jgi:multidrug efflux pump subunit AcrA (membrane-fusion protein)
MRWLALLGSLLLAAPLPAEEELPKDPEPMDIEPPLLIQETPNRNIVYTAPATPGQKDLDPDRITAALEKAKRNAASGERLYKGGIIAKVDAENRALKVIKLEADLAEAKLELAKQNLEVQQVRLDAGEISSDELETAKSLLASATKEAESASARKRQADLEAAELNLRRQQKLLAMGSGRKSEVSRAQEKVSALQQKN